MIEINTKEKQNEAKISELEETVRESNVKELLLRTKIANARSTSQSVDDLSETSSVDKNQVIVDFGGCEAQIVSLSTAFLVIHPHGATVDALLDYVREFNNATSENELIDVLVKHEKLFRVDGDRKWHFCGFKI